jgi:23S rRNA (adenine2503-C2)-methyltransferase
VPLCPIKSQSLENLQAQLHDWGEPAYRATQVVEWLYTRRAPGWDAMTNLPRRLRERLAQHYAFTTLELVAQQGSADATRKFLWRLDDRALIESVLIPASPTAPGADEETSRQTLCISTQVGCAYGCAFCASGLGGFKRNLGADEIVEQVLAAQRRSRVDNLVVMGMGEPLANYDNLIRALRILNAPWGANIGARRITVSTSGLCPQIRRLAGEPQQFRLAISLHGATDDVRNRLMPINHKHPLRDLIAACEAYQTIKGRLITLEYILISGVNDGLDQTRPLAALARRLHAKVNLISYNRVDGLPWQRPSQPRQELFLAALQRHGVKATLRRERGDDIDAACGQLRLRTEPHLAAPASAVDTPQSR